MDIAPQEFGASYCWCTDCWCGLPSAPSDIGHHHGSGYRMIQTGSFNRGHDGDWTVRGTVAVEYRFDGDDPRGLLVGETYVWLRVNDGDGVYMRLDQARSVVGALVDMDRALDAGAEDDWLPAVA